MSVGVWDPSAPASGAIDLALLRSVAEALDEGLDEGLEEVSGGLLASLGLETSQWLMQCESADWAVAEALDTALLEALIRFFTLVERDISGWEAGSKSPVIALVKIVKAREAFTGDLRRWIKAHTDNRYLPYGSAL